MIGDRYWATGITVTQHHDGEWGASVDFYDDGFCEDASTEGTLHTRYPVRGPDALSRAIDTVKADAERLGIQFGPVEGTGPYLYGRGDGEDEEWPLPEGWRDLLNAEAKRLDWKTISQPASAPTDEPRQCDRCKQPAVNRVEVLSARTGKVRMDYPACADHARQERVTCEISGGLTECRITPRSAQAEPTAETS